MLLISALLNLGGLANAHAQTGAQAPPGVSSPAREGQGSRAWGGYVSFSAGPAIQSFSPGGSVWTDEKFTEPIVFPTARVTHGAFALSGGFIYDRWGLLFDVDARLPGTAKVSNVLVGASALRLVTNRFRVQGGLGLGGLFAQHDVVKKGADNSATNGPRQVGAGVYGAAIFDLVRCGSLWLNLQARFTAAAYEKVAVKSMSVQLGISN